MKVFAISDLHLSVNNPKPMDIFGPAWENYLENIFADWKAKVGQEDLVLLAGDFSWAMHLEDTEKDFALLSELPGKKVLIRGNHDYWWKSISGVRNVLPQEMYAIQNDALYFENLIICGTRGWMIPEGRNVQTPEDEKIFKREVLRLEISLKAAAAKRHNGEKLICMLHYPPMNFKREDSEFSKLLEAYQVDMVVFGHLHGYKNAQLSFVKNGISYYLTSCDLTGQKLTEICEV